MGCLAKISRATVTKVERYIFSIDLIFLIDLYLFFFLSIEFVRNGCTLVYARLNYGFARSAFIIIAREVVVTVRLSTVSC